MKHTYLKSIVNTLLFETWSGESSPNSIDKLIDNPNIPNESIYDASTNTFKNTIVTIQVRYSEGHGKYGLFSRINTKPNHVYQPIYWGATNTKIITSSKLRAWWWKLILDYQVTVIENRYLRQLNQNFDYKPI